MQRGRGRRQGRGEDEDGEGEKSQGRKRGASERGDDEKKRRKRRKKAKRKKILAQREASGDVVSFPFYITTPGSSRRTARFVKSEGQKKSNSVDRRCADGTVFLPSVWVVFIA